jgi:hypothetical protein
MRRWEENGKREREEKNERWRVRKQKGEAER